MDPSLILPVQRLYIDINQKLQTIVSSMCMLLDLSKVFDIVDNQIDIYGIGEL